MQLGRPACKFCCASYVFKHLFIVNPVNDLINASYQIHHFEAHEFPLDSNLFPLLDPVKRKAIPQWIREALEKREKEKQKELAKQQDEIPSEVKVEDEDKFEKLDDVLKDEVEEKKPFFKIKKVCPFNNCWLWCVMAGPVQSILPVSIFFRGYKNTQNHPPTFHNVLWSLSLLVDRISCFIGITLHFCLQ